MRVSVSYLRCLSFYIEDDKYTNIISDIDNAVLEYEEVLNVSDKDLIFSKYENLYSILNEHTTKLKKYFKDFDADDFIKNELFIDNQINKEKQSFIEKEIIKAYLYEKYLLDFYGTVSLYTKITKNELVKQGRNYDDLIPMAMLEEGGNDEIGTDRNVVKIYVYSDGTISEKRDSSLSKISFNCLKDTSGFDWSAKGYDVNMSLENEFNFSIDRDEDEEGVESVPVEQTYEDEIIEGIIFDVQNNDFASILSNFNFDEFELNLDILLDSKKNAYIQDFNFLFFILCAIVMQMRENEKEDVDDSSLDIIESRVQRIKSDIKSKLTEEGIENIKGFLLSAVDSPILEKIAIFFPKTKDIFNKTDEEKRTIYLSVLGEVLSADFEILTDEKENQLFVESSCKRIEVDVSPFVESTIKKTIVLAQRESSNVDENKVRNEKMSDLPANILDEESGKAKNLEDDILSADNVENVPYRIENAELNLSRADNIDKDTNDTSASDEELDTKSEEEEISSNTAKTNDDKSADAEEDKGKKSPLPWWGITLIAVGSAVFAGIVGTIIYRKTCGAKPSSKDDEDKSISGGCSNCEVLDERNEQSELHLFGKTVKSFLTSSDISLLNDVKWLNEVKKKGGSLPHITQAGNVTEVVLHEAGRHKLNSGEKVSLRYFFQEKTLDYKDKHLEHIVNSPLLQDVLKVLYAYYFKKDNQALVQLADDYAEHVLGLDTNLIENMKYYAYEDLRPSTETFIGITHTNDRNGSSFEEVHDIFKSPYTDISFPTYVGSMEMKRLLGNTRYEHRDYYNKYVRSSIPENARCSIIRIYNNEDNIKFDDISILPIFMYPDGKTKYGFSPLFFDEEYDKEQAQKSVPYVFSKIYYLATVLHRLKYYYYNKGFTNDYLDKLSFNMVNGIGEFFYDISDVNDYKSYNFTDPVCIDGYKRKGYDVLPPIISGLCFGMASCTIESSIDNTSHEILIPTLTQKNKSITSSLLAQINIFLSDLKSKFTHIGEFNVYHLNNNNNYNRNLDNTIHSQDLDEVDNEVLFDAVNLYNDEDYEIDYDFRCNHNNVRKKARYSTRIRYINVRGIAKYMEKRRGKILGRNIEIENKDVKRERNFCHQIFFGDLPSFQDDNEEEQQPYHGPVSPIRIQNDKEESEEFPRNIHIRPRSKSNIFKRPKIDVKQNTEGIEDTNNINNEHDSNELLLINTNKAVDKIKLGKVKKVMLDVAKEEIQQGDEQIAIQHFIRKLPIRRSGGH